MQRNVAKFVELNLGDTTNSGSDTILRYALVGPDVLYNGNVYKGDGNLLDIGEVEIPYALVKTSIDLTFSSTNLTLMGHFNQRKYLNHTTKVWIADRNADGSLKTSTIKQIFSGYGDTHDVSRSEGRGNEIVYTSADQFARFEQLVGNTTSSSNQKFNIQNGLYPGIAVTTVDKGFDRADEDFGGLTLGLIPARTITHEQIIEGPRKYILFGPKQNTTVTTTEYIPGDEGEQLSDTGSDYTKALVYGGGHVRGNLIWGLNPTPSAVHAAYPDMANAEIDPRVTDNTRYATIMLAVAEGVVGNIGVLFGELESGSTMETVYVVEGQKTYVKDNSGNTVAAVEMKGGAYDQAAYTTLQNFDNDYTTDHRCLGTATLLITLAASPAFADGWPPFSVIVGGKQHKVVTKTGDVYTLADSFGYTETVSTLYGRLEGQVPTISELPDNNVPQSASPAFVILDILLSNVYGLSVPQSEINLKSFYDSYQNEIDRSNSQVGNYDTVCRGVLKGAQSAKNRLDSVLSVAKANLCVIDGQINLIHNKYLGTDAATIASGTVWNESTFIDGIHDIKFSPTSDTINTVDITAPVSNSLNQEEFRTTLIDSNALAAANGKESKRVIKLPMASVEFDVNGNLMDSSGEVLAEIGRIIIRRSQVYVTGSCLISYWDHQDLKPGDIRVIDSKRFNLTGAGKILVKIVNIKISGLGDMIVEFVQFSNLIYDNSSSDITEVTRGIIPANAYAKPDTFSTSGSDGATGADGSYNITVYQDAASKPTISGGTPSTTSRTELAVLPTNWLGDPTPGDILQRYKAVTSIDPTVVAAGDKKEKATFTEGPGITGGSITSAIAQINTTLYNTGTSGNASGSTTVAEEVFFDIAGNFPAANYPVTRDSLKATFSVGSETEFTFDDFEKNEGYTVTFSGINFGASGQSAARLSSTDNGFILDGATAQIFLGYSGTTSFRRDELTANLGLFFYYSSTATTEAELVSELTSALQALAVTGSTTTISNLSLSDTTTTYEVSRSVDVSSDGDNLVIEHSAAGIYTDVTVELNIGGSTSTISNTAGVYRPRNDGFAITFSGFTFPISAIEQSETNGVASEMFPVTGQSSYSLLIGVRATNAALRLNQVVFNTAGPNLAFISATATSEEQLATQAAAAFQALATSGTTSIPDVVASSSTTYEVSRLADITSSGSVLDFEYIATGDNTDVTLTSSDNTSTVENFAYVAESAENNAYYEVTLDGFTLPSNSFQTIVIDGTDMGWTVGGSNVTRMVLGTNATTRRQNEVTFSGTLLFYYDETATTETALVAAAQSALQAISNSTGTSINHVTVGDSSTATVVRSVNVTASDETLTFTRTDSGNFSSLTFGVNNNDSTGLNVPIFTLPYPDYSTTALVAARIVDQGYTGVTLTVDNTYDIVANPLGAGDVRIKGVYDALGTQTDVTSASFVIVQGTDGTLTLEGVGIVTQGGGVTHVGDTLALTNVDTNNGHSASAANVTLSNDITGNTVRDVIDTLWTGLGGFTIDKTTTGTVLATDTAAGDSSDPVLVHTPGTGSTLVISSSVTTDGVDGGVETGTNTNTTTVAGVAYLTVFGVGIGGSARATAVYNTLNAASAVTDDYDLVIDGDTWSIERKIFGNQTNVLSVIDTGKLNQTAVDPSVVRVEGVLTDLVWTDPVEDGELVAADGTSILKGVDGTLSVGEINSNQVITDETFLGAVTSGGSFNYSNSIRFTSIRLNGDSVTGQQLSNGSSKGPLTVVVSTGNITIDTIITANGGSCAKIFISPTFTQGNAGNAGDVTLTATTGDIIIKATTGVALQAYGGSGGSTSFVVNTGGDGGDGGTITLSAPLGCINIVQGFENTGAGSDGTGPGTNGDGGDTGAISKNNALGNACVT